MPQLDLTRIFIDNLIWSLGFTLLFIAIVVNLYIFPYIEILWFGKFKLNFKVALKYKLLDKRFK